MMQAHVQSVQRQLGELGVLAKKTEDAERRILSIAEQRLSEIATQISDARVSAVSGDDAAKDKYTSLIDERGRLNQVIARARAALGNS